MVDLEDSRRKGNVHEIAPFKPVENTTERDCETTFEEIAIAADHLENMVHLVLTYLSDSTNQSEEMRRAGSVIEAMLFHTSSLKQHCK